MATEISIALETVSGLNYSVLSQLKDTFLVGFCRSFVPRKKSKRDTLKTYRKCSREQGTVDFFTRDGTKLTRFKAVFLQHNSFCR